MEEEALARWNQTKLSIKNELIYSLEFNPETPNNF